MENCLYTLCSTQASFEMTHERVEAYTKLRTALTTAPFLFHPDFKKHFKLYLDACMDGLGAAWHQIQSVNDKPVEGPICFISRKLKDSEKRYGATQ